jgi:hypothetical protein
MAIPDNIYRTVWSGILGPGVDTWQCRMHFQVTGSHPENFDSTLQQNAVNGAGDQWGGKISESSAPIFTANDTILKAVSLYKLDTDGHVLTEVQASSGHVNVAGTGGNSLPSEVSVCVSLDTALLGRSNRGRLYLPGICVDALQGDGTLASSYQDNIATQVAAMITALNTDIGSGAQVINYGVLSITKGTFEEYLLARCGNVLDVQRRRRNGAAEVYADAGITPAL